MNKQSNSSQIGNTPLVKGYVIALIILLADQLHKWYMLEIVKIEEKAPIEVTSFFNFVMVWNPGISFGMFRDNAYSVYIFSTLAVVIVIALSFWLAKAQSKVTVAAIGFVIGGAIGNVIDRIRFGAVADFFDFHLMGYHWPAFNIADALVFTGALLLCIENVLGTENKDSKASV